MIGAFVIFFREMLEAGLIIGIALAVTRGVPGSVRWIFGGLFAGIAGSVAVATATGAIASSFSGTGQELFNAGALSLAVLMLGWHNVWMARHGRQLAAEMRQTGEEIGSGSRTVAALAVVVGLAVLREGAEVVLFSYGMLASGGVSAAGLAAGGVGGLIAGGAISALLYFGLVRIPMRRVFGLTSWLIALLAAGMAAHAVGFLEQAGLVTAFGTELWDTSAILPQDGLPGSILHTLVGYMDRPTGAEFLVWLVTLTVIVGLTKLLNHSPAAAAQVRTA